MTPTWILAALAVGGYLLGSIPFGVIVARLGGVGDIRKVGSGNIGATNVLRTGRKDLALITLIGDGGKGAAAVGLAFLLVGRTADDGGAMACSIAAGAAFLGHLFPVWLGFRGGKGVATFLGSLLALAWPVGVVACMTWLIVAFIGKRSSLAALTAAVISPPYAGLLFSGFLNHSTALLSAITVMAVLVVIRHRDNIRRLMAGTEPKIGADKAKAA